MICFRLFSARDNFEVPKASLDAWFLFVLIKTSLDNTRGNFSQQCNELQFKNQHERF